jgi:hypothetical protein
MRFFLDVAPTLLTMLGAMSWASRVVCFQTSIWAFQDEKVVEGIELVGDQDVGEDLQLAL